MWMNLLYQLPAIFTAAPMVARLLPFRLPKRVVPLFYFIVSLVVMLMPGRVDLALGAAGLISMLHLRLGENLANGEPPDMKEVANTLALGWDYIVTRLQALPISRVGPGTGHLDAPTVHDGTEDGKEAYPEPPSPPEERIRNHIPHLD